MSARAPSPQPGPLFGSKGAPSYEKVSACVHCGLCLEACPTYRELRVEMDSPRGRIYLMKGILQGQLAPTEGVLRHLDQCLDCRACETACPSGVQYGHILERTRSLLQPQRRVGPLGRVLRWFVFGKLLPSRAVQRAVFKVLWLLEVVGLLRLGRWLGQRGWLPGRLGKAAAQAPTVGRASFREQHRQATVFPAKGERRARVALFTGCIADHLCAEVNEASVTVLTENGCEVEVVAGERCCGALHIHNGELDAARELARGNVAAFSGGGYDAVVVSAAGCSAELRHYGELLEGDPEARGFGARVRDISEFLVELGLRPPPAALPRKRLRVAYADPCHLVHAQGISEAPRRLLGAIEEVELVPLEDADACCGSAGLYSLLNPQLSAGIAARKIETIRHSGAQVVATGNPGCLLQLRNGIRAAELEVQVVHPVELLARMYRGGPSSDR